MFMLQSCRACDSHLLLLPMHEAEEISLKDNSSFLINNSGDRQKKKQRASASGAALFFPPYLGGSSSALLLSDQRVAVLQSASQLSDLPCLLLQLSAFANAGRCQTSTVTARESGAGDGNRCIDESRSVRL